MPIVYHLPDDPLDRFDVAELEVHLAPYVNDQSVLSLETWAYLVEIAGLQEVHLVKRTLNITAVIDTEPRLFFTMQLAQDGGGAGYHVTSAEVRL